MSRGLSARLGVATLALALVTGFAGLPSRAAAAEEEIKCANCNKTVKKSKAIKVIKDGQVYYVCSEACAKKIKNKK